MHHEGGSNPSPGVSILVDAHCDLGEGPIYDARIDVAYFVDINKRLVHAVKPNSPETATAVQLKEPVGAVALTDDPALLIACCRSAIYVMKAPGGNSGNGDAPSEATIERTLVSVDEKDGVGEELRFNDCKVSPQGALLAGRMHKDWRKGCNGRLYALDPGASQLREVLGPSAVGLPNGMAWSGNGKVFYFVDSAAETVTAYDCDSYGVPIVASKGDVEVSTTSRTAKIIYHRPSNLATVPDGMTIDADGNLWIALGESGSIVCVSPDTGEELHRVSLPVRRPTSCGFGGRDLEDLYVTTRVEKGEDASPHHGALFVVRGDGIRGLTSDFFFTLPK